MGHTYKLTGGDKLGKALELIAAKAKDSVVVRVGFPIGATEPDGQPTALVAFLNEFGKTVRSKEGDYYQLPRPFFRNMISKCSKDWPEQLAEALRQTDYDAVEALKIVGEEIKSALIESINELYDPPLAPSTIRKKKFSAKLGPSKPLIDSSTMSKAPTFWIDGE
jgi:hypothetical protein